MQWLIDLIVRKAVPPGTIVMWWGLASEIPAGWAYCGGGFGTPDLRGRFVVQAGDGYAPGDTGGSATHTHGKGTGLLTGTSKSRTAGNIPPYHCLVYMMKL